MLGSNLGVTFATALVVCIGKYIVVRHIVGRVMVAYMLTTVPYVGL